MANFTKGESVAIRCEVQPGAFEGEFLVNVPVLTGFVSGFVRKADLVDTDRVLGIVQDCSSGTVSIKLAGSYFTTNGLVDFSYSWAQENVRLLA